METARILLVAINVSVLIGVLFLRYRSWRREETPLINWAIIIVIAAITIAPLYTFTIK